MRRDLAFAIAAAAGALLALAPAAVSAKAPTAPPVLTGETLSGTATTTCQMIDFAGNMTWIGSGVAAGPYPGTFTTSGVGVGPTTGSSIYASSVSGTFTITSSAGTVDGTMTMTAPPGTTVQLTCSTFSGTNLLIGPLSYSATIVTEKPRRCLLDSGQLFFDLYGSSITSATLFTSAQTAVTATRCSRALTTQ